MSVRGFYSYGVVDDDHRRGKAVEKDRQRNAQFGEENVCALVTDAVCDDSFREAVGVYSSHGFRAPGAHSSHEASISIGDAI